VKRLIKRKPLTIILSHAGIALFVWVYMTYLGCPVRRFFGVSCPGCGMGRAHLELLQGNISEAFSFHPLFFLALPLIFLFLHSEIYDFHIPKKLLNIAGIATIILLLAVYLLRVFVLHSPAVAPDFENSVLGRILESI
jgi:hypothetical protein